MELSTGPLGLGLSAGLGMAMADRIKGLDAYTYVVMGDGEIEEGCIWEAAMSASKFRADHLIGILDNNGVQLDGTLEEIMPMGDIGAKWKAFGWNVIPCDGHDVEDFCRAVEEAKKTKGRPSLILAATVKGKGVSFMEGKNTWHGKAINDNEYAQAKAELGRCQIMGENIAIRDAYGAALKELGEQNEKIVGLEADVASSTRAEFLEGISGTLL